MQGDVVKARIVANKGNYIEANLVEVLKPSCDRINSQCKYSIVCGACDWQELKYEMQLKNKKSFIKESLERIAGVKDISVSITSNNKSTYYRNRILLRGTIHEDRTVSLGFFKKNTHTQNKIKSCLNADKAINNIIEKIYEIKCDDKKQKFRMELQFLPERHKNGKSCVVVILHPLGKNKTSDLKEKIKSLPSVAWVGYKAETTTSKIISFEEDQEKIYFTKPGLFQQVNLEMNQVVRERLKKFVINNKISNILDLYCGSGNLSMHLASDSCRVTGVELSSAAIEVSKTNIEKNKIINIHYESLSSSKALEKLIQKSIKFDLIISDPPRRGMKESLSFILEIAPVYIAYLSCNPSSMARDVKYLLEKYQLISVEGFDFFPNTYHVESLILFKLKNY